MEIIRGIYPEDIESIVPCYIETNKREPWNEDWDFEIAKCRIEDLVKNSLAITYGIYGNEQFIGGIFGRRGYYLKSKEYFIDEFFIDWKYQHKGFGSRLLEFAESDLKLKDYSTMVLNTEKGIFAELFYKNKGFKLKESMILMFKNI